MHQRKIIIGYIVSASAFIGVVAALALTNHVKAAEVVSFFAPALILIWMAADLVADARKGKKQ